MSDTPLTDAVIKNATDKYDQGINFYSSVCSALANHAREQEQQLKDRDDLLDECENLFDEWSATTSAEGLHVLLTKIKDRNKP